jgi:site-specific DNA-methyltransferase (adenine-specific)
MTETVNIPIVGEVRDEKVTFYKKELPINQIIHGDCLEVMKTFPDKSVDLVLTSPSYNLYFKHHTGVKYHNPYDDQKEEKVYQAEQREILNELWRIVKDDGSVMYNHKNRFIKGEMVSPYKWIFPTKWVIKQEVIWQNGSQNFDKIRFYPMTERVYWLAKNPKTVLQNKINAHDIFKWNAEGMDNEHTRAFPLEMAEQLISCFPEANVILDPFGGSCTTAVACKQLKRNYICIEKEEKYVQICHERLAATTSPMF